jgi:hypothetical protein
MNTMHLARRQRWARLLLFLAISAGSAGRVQAQVGAGGPVVSNSTVGYVDSAIPGNLLRFRFDAGYDNTTPSRGEFFYARSPTRPGDRAETRVDYQELSAYVEKSLNDRLSLFFEVPVRFLNPTVDQNVTGLGDVDFGFKWAFLQEEDRVVSFQLRAFAPTGNGPIGLGNSHVSLEPALLGYCRPLDRLSAEGELRVFVPLTATPAVEGAVSGSASNFASTVVRYGVGLGYDLYQCGRFVVTPVTEMVGWTFLNGKKIITPVPQGIDVSAAGDTIVNLKVGTRFKLLGVGDLYIGYGHALTDQKMYRDIVRAELRLVF